MKKYLNERNDAVLSVRLVCIDKNAKEGESTEHKQVVQDITLFQQIEDGKWVKFSISRDDFKDISHQINEIESINIIADRDDGLPF